MDGVDKASFILPTRRHIMEGPLLMLKHSKHITSKRHIFLFNDLLVICKQKPGLPPIRFVLKYQFELSTVRVVDIADRDGLCYLLGITVKDSDIQIDFLCSTSQEKLTWIATLKKIIKEIQIKDIQELKSAIAAAGIKSGSAIHQP